MICPPVETTLFLPRPADIVPARLLAGFNGARPAGLPALRLDDRQSLRARRFHCGRFAIDIAQCPAQSGTSPFGTGTEGGDTLTGLRRLSRPSAPADPAAGHRATLMISVSDNASDQAGPTSPQLNHPEEMPHDGLRGGHRDREIALRRMMLALAHRVATLCARQVDAMAAHWGQSDRLLPIGDFVADRLPAAICFVPQVFTSGSRHHGRRLTGFRAKGSEDLLGRLLIMHETALPLDRACALAAALIDRWMASDTRPTPGEALDLPGWPTGDIRLRPPSGSHPMGTVEIMLRDIGGAAVQPHSGLRGGLRGTIGRLLPPTGRITPPAGRDVR